MSKFTSDQRHRLESELVPETIYNPEGAAESILLLEIQCDELRAERDKLRDAANHLLQRLAVLKTTRKIS